MTQQNNARKHMIISELDTGRVHPWVGSIHGSGPSTGRVHPWVGSIHGSGPSMGRVHPWVGFIHGSGWVTKFSVLGGSGWIGSSINNI